MVIDPALVWATYAGGLESDEARGLAVDSEDHVIITGRTYSSDNIATAGAYQTEKLGTLIFILFDIIRMALVFGALIMEVQA